MVTRNKEKTPTMQRTCTSLPGSTLKGIAQYTSGPRFESTFIIWAGGLCPHLLLKFEIQNILAAMSLGGAIAPFILFLFKNSQFPVSTHGLEAYAPISF